MARAVRGQAVSFFVLSCLLGLSFFAHAEVLIGVLAHRGAAQALAAWQPTADYLSARLGNDRVRILPFEGVGPLEEAVGRREVDFAITNPESYVLLEARHHATRIATLTRRLGGHVVKEFGGVIIVRADRHDLNDYADLRGRRIAAVGPNAFGGYLMQAGELLDHDFDVRSEGKLLWLGLPQDKIVDAVLTGAVDAGFVRTGLIEEMVSEGKLAAGSLRILGGRRIFDFPLPTSTALYPEWPIAALAHTPEPLSRKVAIALFALPPDSAPARAGGYHHWTIPLSYSVVHDLMRKLRQPPYDRPPAFSPVEMLKRYALPGLLLLSVLLILLTLALLRFSRLSRSLALQVEQRQRAEKQLAWENQALEMLARGASGHDSLAFLLGRCARPAAIFVFVEGGLQPRATRGIAPPLPPRLPWDGYGPGEMAQQLNAALARPDCQTVAVIELRSAHGLPIGLAALFDPAGASPSAEEREALREVALLAALIIESELAEADQRLSASVFDNALEGIIICDPDLRIRRVNLAFLRMLGYDAQEVIGQRPALFRSGRQDKDWYRAMWQDIESQGRWRGEIWNRHRDGHLLPLMLHISTVRDTADRLAHYIGIYTDISDIKSTQQQLERLANYDTLTQLPNRAQLMDRLRQALAYARRQKTLLAVCFVDLDGFKPINDVYGHEVGDALLVEIASRLSNSLRVEDTAARLGGDEFVLLLTALADAHQARVALERLLGVLDQPFLIAGQALAVSASIGVTLFPQDDSEAEVLLRHADQAMYRAKRAGRNRLAFFETAEC